MIVPNASNLSDDSDDEVDNDEVGDTYSKKYKLLLERCEVLQLDNERLVHRIQQVRKILRRCRKERKFLMERLDQHGDNWQNMQLPLTLDEPMPVTTPHVTPKAEKHYTKGNDRTSHKASAGEKVGRKNTATGSGTKRKYTKHSEKPERDPNAPKRPANPFFQFCQEQRPIVMERLGMEQKSGDAEPSKQELTRQLASKWNTLPPEDKKVWRKSKRSGHKSGRKEKRKTDKY
ncbi:hypothetical protein R5R35_003391 [Gryllus longicercus]|uniref:HMG box domain-containing protein n=1 Tax=Gryllus longicercus TaxID=2509291 RepID=A0AAN9VVJ4_9ORTH